MNVIITGASSGIGYELAGQFAKAGHVVIAIARQGDKLKQLESENAARMVLPLQLDLINYEYSSLMELLQSHSIDHIDILVHNAGFLINKPFFDLNSGDWEYTYKVNVIAVAMLTKALIKEIGGDNHTHIVMMGSIGGMNGSLKYPGLTAYSSSKGAMAVLTETMAEEFKGKNASVNYLALGSVQTEMLEKAFPGYVANVTPQAISSFLFDFCLNGWRYFNGKILPVSTGNP